EWDITHTTSSPYYPRSNGLIERHIQTVKNLMKKAIEDHADFDQAIMDYNTTPKENLPSPAEMLMSRRLKTRLPIHPEALYPQWIDHSKIRRVLQQQQLQ